MSTWTLPPRQTAASTALMPHARPWRCGQAPQPRSGAPKAQGLTASPTVAAPSPVPSSTVNFFTDVRPPIDTTNTPRNYTSLTDAIMRRGLFQPGTQFHKETAMASRCLQTVSQIRNRPLKIGHLTSSLQRS